MMHLIRQGDNTAVIIQMVLDGLESEHTKRAYARHLKDFISWHAASGETSINQAVVQRYTAQLREAGRSAATINQKLSAIRKLATEAADNGALDSQIANGVRSIKGARQEGIRTGNWLTKQQAQKMLNAPDTDRLKGLRDRAILAVLIGCGLRRGESASLRFDHIQQRDGRWVLVDLVGKRNKVRSVPMPSWAKAAIDAYSHFASLSDGFVFRPINKGGRMTGERMTEQAIYNVVSQYAEQLGQGEIAPHD